MTSEYSVLERKKEGEEKKEEGRRERESSNWRNELRRHSTEERERMTIFTFLD
jgi:hypothetical protein